MATSSVLELTADQQAELEQVRDRAPLPYLRERAAAVLKVAHGASIRQVARSQLLRPHQPDTLCAWIRRYRQEGVAGLVIRKGRGRKPASFPRAARRRRPADR